MQLKIFIISYVNSLERKKYVTVWFSSIQERIQCLSAQYSYHLTVNSFWKAFAHVRNYLLMKKMSGVHKSNRGRTKHWRILHENDTKRRIQQNTTKREYPYVVYMTDGLNLRTSVINSSYHMLLGKLRNCSRFIINHVLMVIPPTDDAKHSNSFH